jgi:integrase
MFLAPGEMVKAISDHLGHANMKITLDAYEYVLPTMQKGAADKL